MITQWELQLEDLVSKSVNRALITDRQYEAVTRRFGLMGHHMHSLDELAGQFNVTRERARQWEAQGLRKIREAYRTEFERFFAEHTDTYKHLALARAVAQVVGP